MLFHICHSNWHNSYGSGDGLLVIINSPKLPCSYPMFCTPLGLLSWIKTLFKNKGQGHRWLERWIRKGKNERKGGSDESYTRFTEAILSDGGWPTRSLYAVLELLWASWPTPIDIYSTFYWWSYLLFNPFSLHLLTNMQWGNDMFFAFFWEPGHG